MTTFSFPLYVGGVPVLPGFVPILKGNVWHVNGNLGGSGGDGKRPETGFATIQAGVNRLASYDTLIVHPKDGNDGYDEAVTVPYTLQYVNIIGAGGRGAASIQPSTGNQTGLTIKARDVTIVNLAASGVGTGVGVRHYADRLRCISCKFEGGANVGELIGGEQGGGRGADNAFFDCEFAWSAAGLRLSEGFIGACTQVRFSRCLFHNLTASAIVDGSGTASDRFRNLVVEDCTFDALEDGTQATKYLSLNGNNGNTGVVTRCSFPCAINSGRNLVSTALLWIGNFHTGGLSTAQPS